MILTGHISLLQSLQPYAWQGDLYSPKRVWHRANLIFLWHQLKELRATASDLRYWLGAPVGLPLAVVVGLPAIAIAVVVGLRAEHHPSLAADRQGVLPEIKAE